MDRRSKNACRLSESVYMLFGEEEGGGEDVIEESFPLSLGMEICLQCQSNC